MKVLASLLCLLFIFQVNAQDFFLFVGTYTTGASKGIYVYQFNSKTGQLSLASNTDSSQNPSYLTLSPNGQFLYACNETGGKEPGRISAYQFDKKNGRLTYLNSQLSGGDHPCYISSDQTGKWVVAANYTGGNFAAFLVNKDGKLSPYSQLIQHQGKGPNLKRQLSAHVHASVFSPDYQYLITPDLGMDKMLIYPFQNKETLPIINTPKQLIASIPGGGPRHVDFHPNGKWIYLIEELTGSIQVAKWNNGNPLAIQSIATHPNEYQGEPGSADIHLSPDGKFLYASNRGKENNLAIFAVNPSNGRLSSRGYQPTEGEQPRNFLIDPTGNYLLVANQRTNHIVVFSRNRRTGLLTNTNQSIPIPNPVCLKMLKK